MKRLLTIITVVAFSLCLATGAQAQTYERKDFTLKSEKIKNAEGEISEIKVSAYVGKKLIKAYTYELVPALSEDMAGYVGTISEYDLNFDGYPDADIYLGYMGGFANNTQHEALLWDQSEHCFVEGEGYGEIGEPVVDEEKKYIQTTLSAGPDHRVTNYYRWQGHRLQPYLDYVWPIQGDDDDYVSLDGILNLPLQRYNAKLDGRIPVIIVFQTNADSIAAGYIYYPRAKKPAPIMIVGGVTRYGDTDYYHFSEYQSDGIITGFINFGHKVVDGWEDKVEGTWTNPKTNQEMPLTDVSFNRECPKWFTKSLLTPEDPGNIGHEYSFRQWNEGYQDLIGGHITFRGAGKNKVHFECGNIRHNIAEGHSDDDRPAVLKGNVFEYRDINECGYGFRATFFPRFVVLQTITDSPSYDCFGAGASFDGVYIKVKQ